MLIEKDLKSMDVLYQSLTPVIWDIPLSLDLLLLVEAPKPMTTPITCWWVANQLLALSANIVWEVADFSWFFALTDILVDSHMLSQAETMTQDSRIAIYLDPGLRTITLVSPPDYHPERTTIDRAAVITLGTMLTTTDLDQTIQGLKHAIETPDCAITNDFIAQEADNPPVADGLLEWCQAWFQAQSQTN